MKANRTTGESLPGTPAPLTTGTLLGEALRRLAPTLDHPQLDAELLLAHVLGVPRARLKSHPEESRTASDRDRYVALVERRALGEPLAYLIGRKAFWSIELTVGPGVLVPRPETELLVERALALRPEAAIDAADLGTGSGALALALAHERPEWRITATDASDEALRVARRNAAHLGITSVEFLAGDWLTPLAGRKLHLLLSNPPYVASADPALDSAPLRFEPRAALASGPDGLADLARIIAAAPEHLVHGGWLLLEHGASQGEAVRGALAARGFSHVRSYRDLAGLERMTEARRA